MTEIKMLKTMAVSVDGLRVQTWAAGSTHSVDDDLLGGLIASGGVELIENKAVAAAPENKAAPAKRKKRSAKHD